MVRIIEGDLFETDAELICHQVNCQGEMNSGVALQVKEKFPEVFERYAAFCKSRSDLLGLSYYVPAKRMDDSLPIICNMFAQEGFGYDGGCYTSYEALQNCFNDVKRLYIGKTIAMPYMIGCGLGGGDWNIVYKMIEDTFADCDVILYKRDAVSTQCPFCMWLNEVKLRDEYSAKESEGRPGKTEHKYGAALVHETYYDGSHCGRSTYNTEQLNYCPVCGIKIEEENTCEK